MKILPFLLLSLFNQQNIKRLLGSKVAPISIKQKAIDFMEGGPHEIMCLAGDHVALSEDLNVTPIIDHRTTSIKF